jgi:hypothetical protein
LAHSDYQQRMARVGEVVDERHRGRVEQVRVVQRAITHDDSLVTLERAKAEGGRDHGNYFFLARPDIAAGTRGPATDFTC